MKIFKSILVAAGVLVSLCSFAQTIHIYTVADSGLFVSVYDTTMHTRISYPKNNLSVNKQTSASTYLSLYITSSRFVVAEWNVSTIGNFATTIAAGAVKLNAIVYTPLASTNNTYVVDSGGTLVYVQDSNSLLPLVQDTIGAGESKDYDPFSFGMAFEGATGSVDVTINGVTFTYLASVGSLPYNPSHRQPITVDCTALTAGRIRLLYK